MRITDGKAAVAHLTALFMLAGLAAAGFAYPATEPIAATAALVEGEVVVVPVDEEEAMIVEEGDGFAEGDRIITGEGAALEIRFENGDHMRLGEETDMTIKSLHKKEKDTFSIFGLNVGAVRFYVAKLFSSESKFEYHTRAAIAGVGGSMGVIKALKGKAIKRSGKKNQSAGNKGARKLTSEFMKLQTKGPNNNTSQQSQIYLLQEKTKKKAKKSWMYVIGKDKRKTRVRFNEGFKTSVLFGKRPLIPRLIPLRERLMLLKQHPFKARKDPERNEALKQEQKQKKDKKKQNKKKMLDILTRRISTPINKANPLDKKLQQLDRQYQQGGGVSDKKGTGGDASPNPAPQLPKVKIKINIPSHGSSSGAANRK